MPPIHLAYICFAFHIIVGGSVLPVSERKVSKISSSSHPLKGYRAGGWIFLAGIAPFEIDEYLTVSLDDLYLIRRIIERACLLRSRF